MCSKDIYDQIIPYDPSIHPRNPKEYGGGRVYDINTFSTKAQWVHGIGRYSYHKVSYSNNRAKVTIVCPIHGEFDQSPYNHLYGYGCSRCGGYGSRKSTTQECVEDFEAVHGKRYLYNKVNYVDNRTPVIIECPVHGEFLQSPSNHKMGKGCRKCAGNHKKETKDFVEDSISIHGEGIYSYEKVEYKNAHFPVTITCLVHGDFEQIPNSHLSGNGCPMCARTKRTEKEISEMSQIEKDSPYTIYWVKISFDSNDFHKIGVTKSIDDRFRRGEYKDFDIQILKIETGRKEDILMKEMKILREMEEKNSRFKLPQLKGRFSGWTECFDIKRFDPSSHFTV